MDKQIMPQMAKAEVKLSADKLSVEVTTSWTQKLTQEQLKENAAGLQAHIDDVQNKADEQIASLQAQLDGVNEKLDLF